MNRLPLLALVLAVAAALVGLYFLLSAEHLGPEPVIPLDGGDDARPDRGAFQYDRPVQGGVYAGEVVDLEGQPIVGARVLLVSYGAGGPDMLMQGIGTDIDPDEIRDVPVIGRLTVGGEGITDERGRFRIAADAQSLVTRVLAYHQVYFLDVIEVQRPREDLRLRLQRAGRVVGTVLDDATGRPVPGAVVDLYMQQKVSRVPDSIGNYGAFERKQFDVAWLATLGRFIGESLGPRIWDVVDSQSETLRLRTDANGHFEIGPLGNSVQLEFVITHPDYKWTDFDTRDGKQTPSRLVVEPGQTVEREFRLLKGLHVAGQVVDDAGHGIEDVFVKVQSISAYYRHWWYKHKWRRARTDKDGRFRVDGLAIGSQQVILQHASFGDKTISVEAGTDDLVVVAERFGALVGTLEGVARANVRRRVTVLLESQEENPIGGRQQRHTVPLETTNEFIVQRVPPGRYRVWVKAGKESSAPLELTIVALETVKSTFEVGTGGTILARVVDADGTIVDPASARLVEVVDGAERTLGTFVSRGGELEIEGIAPGTYRLLVSAPGRTSERTERFEVAAERATHVGTVEVQRYAYLSIGIPVNERGRPVELTDDLIVEMKASGAEAWERLHNISASVAVRPGTLEIRARSGAHRFEAPITLQGGETKVVEILFPDPR